jgi:hypothetical protein
MRAAVVPRRRLYSGRRADESAATVAERHGYASSGEAGVPGRRLAAGQRAPSLKNRSWWDIPSMKSGRRKKFVSVIEAVEIWV